MKTPVLVVVLAWAGAGAGGPPYRDVLTTQGAARGYLAPRPPHYAFLGLPYARPPTARDRFKAPEPPVRWSGVFEATHRVRCAQARVRGAHGCLVLNVFTPQDAQALPVVVHVHNGYFASGWGSHRPPERLLNQGFVVVTLNYRLGAEGFLCLGTPDAPGNAGLKDQVAALYWVHMNIEKFGGNPSEVTLYGTGAGAVSTELLLLSGMTEGLAQRVILESGSAISPTSLSYDPIATARHVATSLDEYPEMGTVDDLSDFFQEVSVNRLLNFSSLFTPCLERNSRSFSNLLHKDPMEILQRDSFERVPLLVTYSKEIIDESTLSRDTTKVFHTWPDNFDELLPNNLGFDDEDVKHKISEQLKDLYFGDHILGGDVAECYENYINDVLIIYPIVKSATMHAASSNLPVFLMEFSPPGGSNKTIFDFIFAKENLNDEDELVAEKLVNLWSNFMKFGDPTPLATSILPIVWEPVSFAVKNEKPDVSTSSCLLFNSDGKLAMGRPSSNHVLVIWDHIYENFYKYHTPVAEQN